MSDWLYVMLVSVFAFGITICPVLIIMNELMKRGEIEEKRMGRKIEEKFEMEE